MMKKDGELQNIYENQETWRKIMSFLPDSLHLNETALPQEEFWKWKDNDVHIDRYENPYAPLKIILHHGIGTNGRQRHWLAETTRQCLPYSDCPS